MMTSVKSKLLAIVLMPMALIALMSAGGKEYSSRVADQGMQAITEFQADANDSIAQQAKLLDAMLSLNRSVADAVRLHQTQLLRESAQSQPMALGDASAAIETVRREVAATAELASNLDNQVNAADAAALQKGVAFLMRSTDMLERLTQMLVASNERTVEALSADQPQNATNNFIFEEVSRLAALDRLLSAMVLVARDTAQLIAANNVARADAEVNNVSEIASMTNLITSIALVSILVLVGAFAQVFMSKSVIAPLSAVTAAIQRLANGDLDRRIDLPERKDEIGDITRATKVFHDNALEMRRMTEDRARAEAAVAEERRAMMAELQESFGRVVASAVDGDFTKRVPSSFADAEINELATGVNELLGTVSDGVGETRRVLGKIAEGNLTSRMTGDFRGDFAELQKNLNDTNDRICALVSQISGATGKLNTAASSISRDADQLSSRASSQATSLEETAATMEEMSASIKMNSTNSTDASKLATDASDKASHGGLIVKDAVVAMSTIQNDADKISDIIGVIDGIAFQTNLLALNAAVEAARAGDAGKGFAVVASEVRALAQRASDAARDIRELIQQSASQVASGVDLVTRTGDALEGIVSSVTLVAQSINHIANASDEQSTGVQEIASAVSEMDQMTQQNASMAQQSASNARSLTDSARALRELISFFTIDENNTPAERAA